MISLSILLRSFAFVLSLVFVIPKAYIEWRTHGGKLGAVPFYLLTLWVLGSTFILSSIFFLHLGSSYNFELFDSVIIFISSLVLTMLYRNYDITKLLKGRLKK